MAIAKRSMSRRAASIAAGIAAAALAATCAFAPAANAQTPAPSAQETTQSTDRHFMVYYRAWRDVTMKGVNTDLPDDNWISMYDIPYGVDVVNVFSYVPQGQEEQAQPFYDKLKADYAPYLHSRGIKLVRGIDYSGVAVNGFRTFIKGQGKTVDQATEADYDAYAKQVIDEYMVSVGLDGLDVDMENYPSAADVEISDNVIRALSKHIGPKSDDPDGTMFLYDTNGSNLAPFKNVADCFDYVAYQQYGSSSDRTARAAADYEPYIGNEFVPGLTFPEEGDMNNRWHDASEPYEESHFYQVASYVNEHDLGGMFVYALDRDGRNYDEDLHRIVPSNLLWTKTAITESQGMKLETAKAAANHYLDRMALRQATVRDNGVSVDEARTAVEKAANLYEANKAVLGGDYGEGFSDTYDPTLEAGLLDIDTSVLMQQIDKATEAINADATAADAKIDLRTARDAAIDGLTSRIYTADQVAAWSAALKTALDATTPTPTPDPDEDNDHENDGQENDADTETTPDTDKDANAGNKSQAQPEQLSSTGASVNAIVAAGVALAAAGAALALSRRRA
ncbi:endo-beta-N-acetylglucosaminidase [Bifidobacterium longum]|uniref:endo-beta-N-acetylglucosaminidase n=1 Tax=Bifidobacterium longum TaxID=216816 RepID=UPI00374E4CAD